MTETQIVPGHGQGSGNIKDPITESPYVTVGGDTLPSIAERCGHSGEWLALYDANPDDDWVQAHWTNIQPGLSINIPPEWLPAATKPADDTTTSTKTGSSTRAKEAEKAAEDFERRHSRD